MNKKQKGIAIFAKIDYNIRKHFRREQRFLFFSKKKKPPSADRKFILGLDGKHLKYIGERDPDQGGERVIGKEGAINIVGDEVVVRSSEKQLFRCGISDVVAGELMSRDGVVFSGEDLLTGTHRSVIAYYKYYR